MSNVIITITTCTDDPFDRAMTTLSLAGLDPRPVTEWTVSDRLVA